MRSNARGLACSRSQDGRANPASPLITRLPGASPNRANPLTTKSETMNKSELIESIAKNADMSKADATRALEATVDTIKKALKKGDSVALVGFGTFSVGKRAARTGRNPRTGEPIKIKAAKVPKFSAGKGLKDALN